MPSATKSEKNARQLPDLICFSHLRWDFVFQRPQHLLTRFAKIGRVFYIEEPVAHEGTPFLQKRETESGVVVVVPHIAQSARNTKVLQNLLSQFLLAESLHSYVSWYYTPMALEWARHLKPAATVYDCMDELSAFQGAPPALRRLEIELLELADVVFTGGQSLFEAKRHQHDNIYPFPSSIDAPHFAAARAKNADPADQAYIAHPRLGFFGVIDERMDLQLIEEVATARPDWNFVLIGPVVKISHDILPKNKNIHYLGMKSYKELPSYISGWDVAILPFAKNESTKFISPTKTPEYLAAGRPVVSTSIRDVVTPYGDCGVVHIADTPEHFIAAVNRALAEDHPKRIEKVDGMLAKTSWARTWGRMVELIADAVQGRVQPQRAPSSVPALAKSVAAGT